MKDGVKRIVAQSYHRNGVGGAGAVITIFEAYGHRGQFLATSVFPDRPENPVIRGTRVNVKMSDFATHTVVVKIAEVVKGNIAFAEGNSWRGADQYGMDIARAWQEKCRTGDYPYDPFADDEAVA